MLIKQTIKAEVKSAFEAVINDTSDNRLGAIDKVADKLADAIINAIKSQQITYSTGLISPMGAVTGTFTYTIT